MSDSPTTVGYGRPPEHTRFRKVKSGNPGGRPGPKTLAKQAFDAAIGEALHADRWALKDSRPAKVIEAFARRVALDALDGRPSAQRLLLSIIERHDGETASVEPAPESSAEESAREIFGDRYDEFNARFRAAVKTESVEEGSIIAHLIPHFLMTPGGILGSAAVTAGVVIVGMDKALILEDFVTRYGNRLKRYFGKGGRDLEATKGDLKDFHNTVAAIASDSNAVHKLEAAYFEDGEKKVKAAFKFTTPEARIAEHEIENHKREIEQSTSADHERVLMTFVRPDIRGAEAGKRSGELVVAEKISDKPMPLIYASALAEQRIKYEIRDDESVFKKGFVVDVNVELRRGKPARDAARPVSRFQWLLAETL
jgi:hypothetical protein